MTSRVNTSDRRPTVGDWVFQQLVQRRTLALALVLFGGCLLMMESVLQPAAPQSRQFDNPLPLLGAYGSGIDYYQFWIVGRARQPLRPDNIYSETNRARMAELGRGMLLSNSNRSVRQTLSVQVRGQTIQTFSTPFLYAVINGFASGQYDLDFDLFHDVCLAGLLFTVLVLGLVLRYSLVECLLFSVITLLWNEPLASDLRVGNVNLLQLSGVALYLLLRRLPESRWLDCASGLVLGLLVAFKPTLAVIPMLLMLAWIIDRRWMTLLTQGGAAIVGAGVAFVVGCLFLSSWSAWFDWFNSLSGLESVADLSVEGGNYSLSQVILETTGGTAGHGISPATFLLLGLLILTAIALLLTRPVPSRVADSESARRERDFVVTSLGCCASVVALKMVWIHYYLLLIPIVLYLLRPGSWVKSKSVTTGQMPVRLPVAGLAVSLLAMLAVFGWPLPNLINPSFSLFIGTYLSGAWCLTLLGLAALWFPSAEQASTTAD